MKQQSCKLGNAALIVALFGSALTATAGSLTPPTGPILPTNRVQINQQFGTLPIIISQSGSYVLTGDIVAPPGYTGNGIQISVRDVTLDLNGFAVKGVVGSGTGISAAAIGPENITIRNGSIRFWGGWGVRIGSVLDSEHLCEDLTVMENVGGILMSTSSKITRCIVSKNLADGISTGEFVTVSHCITDENDNRGIAVGKGSRVLSCVTTNNGQDGIFGTGSSISVTDCRSSWNGDSGISIAEEGSVVGNTCIYNGRNFTGVGGGIVVAGRTLVKGNHLFNDQANIKGILANGPFNTIIQNVLTGFGDGIKVTSSGNVITKNVVTEGFNNYDIVANNDVGPIGTAAASTSPWANITD